MASMTEVIRRKLVFIGDSNVGKTRLLLCIRTGEYHLQFIPTYSETHEIDIRFEGKVLLFTLWDTWPYEEYERIRPLSYQGTDVCVLCFAVDDPKSLQNVRDKWIPEFLHFRTKLEAPFLLVGCKADLRRTMTGGVSAEQAELVQKSIGAVNYVECSAKDGSGIDELLMAAARALRPAPETKKTRKCVIL